MGKIIKKIKEKVERKPRAKAKKDEVIAVVLSKEVKEVDKDGTFQVGGDPSWRAEPLPPHVVGPCSECGGSGRAPAVGALLSGSCDNCQGTGIK